MSWMSIFESLAESRFADDQMRRLGDDARDKKDWERCISFYEEYLESAPEDDDIWVQLGHAYKEHGHLELAERCYLRSLSIAPLNPDTHLQLGHVEKLRGHGFQAMARYRKALDIAPDYEAAIEECRRLTTVQQRTELVTDLSSSIMPMLQELRDLAAAFKAELGELNEFKNSVTTDLEIKALYHSAQIAAQGGELSALSEIKQTVGALNRQVEFIKSRLTTYVGRGVALTYLADETPMYVNSHDFGGPANLINGGHYEQENADVILSFVRDDTVFLDIGANLGFFSILVARRVWQHGKVFAFEPHPELFRLLCASSFINGLSEYHGTAGPIVVKNIGLSDRSDMATFTYPDGHLGGGFLSTVHNPSSSTAIQAEIRQLDVVFPADFHCDLIKIDVESHELSVLKGMHRLLERSPHLRIVFEKLGVNAGYEDELEKFLGGLGFELFLIGGSAKLTHLGFGALASVSGYFVASHGTNPIKDLDRARFEIFPRQLSTVASTIRVLTRDVLEASGKVGEMLFHGPYWFLRRGIYAVRFNGLIAGSIAITVTSRLGHPEFSFELGSGITEARVLVTNDVVLFECIGRVLSSNASIALRSLEWIKQA